MDELQQLFSRLQSFFVGGGGQADPYTGVRGAVPRGTLLDPQRQGPQPAGVQVDPRADVRFQEFAQQQQQGSLLQDQQRQALLGDLAGLGQGIWLASRSRFEPLSWRASAPRAADQSLSSLAIALQQPGRTTPFAGFQVY